MSDNISAESTVSKAPMLQAKSAELIATNGSDLSANNETANRINTDLLKPLRHTALFFFMAIGLSHIISGLMVSNDIYTEISNLVNKVLDIPFAVIAAVFGLSHVRIRENSKSKKIQIIALITVTILILLLMLYINILIPDRQ